MLDRIGNGPRLMLAAGIYGLYSQGSWADERGVNFIDSGAPWYDVYATKDGKWLSVGAIETRFYEELVEKLGLASAGLPKQHDRKGWPVLRERFAAVIASRTRDEWERVFEGSDACVAPVLAFGEVEHHPHNVARSTFVRRDGVLQPGPAPRVSRTACEMGPPSRGRGADGEAVLRDWGFAPAEIAALTKAGVVGAAKANP